MTPACLAACFLLGGLLAEPREAPWLMVTPVSTPGENFRAGFRHADIDGDGAMDLLCADGVRLQRNGFFSGEDFAPYPPEADGAAADWDKGALYCRTARGLLILKWRNNGFEREGEAAVEWPHAASPMPEPQPTAGGASVRLEPFLHDLDGDNKPEIVLMDEQGMTIYLLREGGAVQAGTLALLPAMELSGMAERPLWPRPQRMLSLPVRQMQCTIRLSGNTAETIHSTATPDNGRSFTQNRFSIIVENGRFVQKAPPENWGSEPLSGFMHPCRLNGDGQPDFAGFRMVETEGSNLSAPVMEIRATVDGGKTGSIRRAVVPRGWNAPPVFSDIDGDGRLDMVVQATGLYEGGMREAVGRMMTGTRTDHTVTVFRQGEKDFDAAPSFESRFQLDFGAPVRTSPAMLYEYLSGRLILFGDVSGDGKADLLVRNRADRAMLFIDAGNGGTTDRPDGVFTVRGDASLCLLDVNGDGREDLVETWPLSPDTFKPHHPARVWLSTAEGKGS